MPHYQQELQITTGTRYTHTAQNWFSLVSRNEGKDTILERKLAHKNSHSVRRRRMDAFASDALLCSGHSKRKIRAGDVEPKIPHWLTLCNIPDPEMLATCLCSLVCVKHHNNHHQGLTSQLPHQPPLMRQKQQEISLEEYFSMPVRSDYYTRSQVHTSPQRLGSIDHPQDLSFLDRPWHYYDGEREGEELRQDSVLGAGEQAWQRNYESDDTLKYGSEDTLVHEGGGRVDIEQFKDLVRKYSVCFLFTLFMAFADNCSPSCISSSSP
jgi:hypothetical protein